MPSRSPAIAAAALIRPDLRITLSVYAVSRISIFAYLSFRYSTTLSIVSPASSFCLASITPAPSAIEYAWLSTIKISILLSGCSSWNCAAAAWAAAFVPLPPALMEI